MPTTERALGQPGTALSHDHHDEKAIFDHLLRPDDSYDENGVYWADMGLKRRLAFVNKVNNQETRRELSEIGQMIKADPLSPVGSYFRSHVIPGAGLGLEGWDAPNVFVQIKTELS